MRTVHVYKNHRPHAHIQTDFHSNRNFTLKGASCKSYALFSAIWKVLSWHEYTRLHVNGSHCEAPVTAVAALTWLRSGGRGCASAG